MGNTTVPAAGDTVTYSGRRTQHHGRPMHVERVLTDPHGQRRVTLSAPGVRLHGIRADLTTPAPTLAAQQADKLRTLAAFVQANPEVFDTDQFVSIELRHSGFRIQFSSSDHGWKRVLFALGALAGTSVEMTRYSSGDVHVIVSGSFDGVPARVVGVAEDHDAAVIRAAVEWSSEDSTQVPASLLRRVAAVTG